MDIDLDALRTRLGPDLPEGAEGACREAARRMSAAGFAGFLDGAASLARLGKGPGLTLAYLDAMPAVVRDCGEDMVDECVQAVMRLASMTSGEVLALAVSTLPLAAARMGDPDRLRAYLHELHRLSARAPRGLRPMLGRLDALLSALTVSGLRRWAEFGAEAHRRDPVRLALYFSLDTEDSRAMFQRERRGVLLVDCLRRLNYTLRAFWGRDFFVRPCPAEAAGGRPFVEEGALHLPDAVDDIGGVAGLDLYRAMAFHMVAHLSFGVRPPAPDGLGPAQRFLIALAEDARVEARAINAFPGLGKLWRSLLPDGAPHPDGHPSLLLIEAAATALLDPGVMVGDPEIDRLVATFRGDLADGDADGRAAVAFGLGLHDLLSARRALPSLRLLERLRLPFRDDNRFLWSEEHYQRMAIAQAAAGPKQVRRRVGLMEFINETEVETAGEDAQEIWVLGSELFPYEDDGVSFNRREGRAPQPDPVFYPEWDHQLQLYRPDWVTLTECRPPAGDPEMIRAVLDDHKEVGRRIRRIIDRLRPQGAVRRRRLEDGDELDINAAVDSMVLLRLGRPPDVRITMRTDIDRRSLAVLILLDLSASTNDPARGTDRTVLDLTRAACALLATAIAGIGDPFAIGGFQSDGRHDVRYIRIKAFDQPFDAEARGRLAGIEGGLSTRMGAAIRHAGMQLQRRAEGRRLLLVVTDGEPADVDERDPRHLRMDARKAVEDLRRCGVRSHCLTLDPSADRYVERIFGARGYTILDRVARLPEALPALFASLTR
jgi:hypothetical protein